MRNSNCVVQEVKLILLNVTALLHANVCLSLKFSIKLLDC